MKLHHLKDTDKQFGEFLAYCKANGISHDESFVPDENFKPGKNDPAVMLTDDNNRISAAAALMLHPQYRELNKGRFRIFHSTTNDVNSYRKMLDGILEYCVGISYLWAFLPSSKKDTGELWQQLGFRIDRYSWLMQKFTNENVTSSLPDGFHLDIVRNDNDMDDFCRIINICFKDIAGHTELTKETMKGWESEPFHWKEGVMLIKDGERSAGTVRLQLDDDEHGRSVFLEALSVLPEYQGRGIASAVLRESSMITNELGLNRLVLTVNAENENAANLYLREGFKKVKTYVCYGYYIK